MGIFQEQLEPLLADYQKLPLASQIGLGFAAFIVLSVVLNVAKQILFKNPNEPPMVFHWFPLIGNTVEYGMDPPAFFRKMRAKVETDSSPPLTPLVAKLRRNTIFGGRELTRSSMAISSPLSFSARRLPWPLAPWATTSS